VCVVGAGTAGAVAAMSAKAHGVSVALIDTKPRNQIGGWENLWGFEDS